MFTFPKHVSHLVWQLHVTCCVSIVDAIQSRFLAGQYYIISVETVLKFINTSQYPLVELTGAALIIPNSTWKLKLLAHALSFILLFRHIGIKDLDKKCQIKTQRTGKTGWSNEVSVED